MRGTLQDRVLKGLLLLIFSIAGVTCFSQTDYALSFDGVNDFISIPNGVSATFTLEARIKTSATSSTGSAAWQGDVLFSADISGGANDYVFSILNNKLAFDDGNSGTITTVGTTAINDGAWHHVAVVRTAGSPGTVKLYIDGVQNGSTGVAGSAALTANTTISIGGTAGKYFTGYMDELRVWNSARTVTQISTYKNTALVGNEAGLYKYLNLNDGTGSVANNLVSGQTDGTLTNMTTTAATSTTATSGWVFVNCAGLWSGATSTNWATASNWCGGAVPTSSTDVVIPAVATQPTISSSVNCSDLTIKSGATLTTSSAGTLNITGSIINSGTMTNSGTTNFNGTAAQTFSGVTTFNNLTLNNSAGLTLGGDITVNGNLTIAAGTFNANNFNISIAGNWINNGTFTAGSGSVTFTGAASKTVTGSSTTAFNTITVDKGTDNTSIIDVQSLITMTAGGLTITNGTFKLSSNSTITAWTSEITAAPYNIPSTGGLWVNAGTVSCTSNLSFAGLVHVSAGILNVGDATDEKLYLRPGSGSIIVDGGTINISGRLSYANTTDVLSFTMSSGTFNVGTSGNTITFSPFTINASASSFTMSGGTIVIVQSAASNFGYYNAAGTSSVTGGTLQIGNASTPAANTIDVNSTPPIWNLTVNSTNAPVARLTAALVVNNDLTISGSTLDANNFNLTVGGNWVNSGTFTAGTATVTFNGTTAMSGTAVTNTFNNLTVAASSTVTSSSGITGLVVNGTLTTGASATLDLGTATILSGTLGTISNSGTIITSVPTTTSATPLPAGKTWGGTIDYANAGANQTVAGGTYNNLTVRPGNAKVATASGNLVVNGTLTVTTGFGAFDLSTYVLSGSLTSIVNNGDIRTSNTSGAPIPAGKTWGGTIYYNATAGSQTVVGGTYNIIRFSNTSGTNTASGDLTVNNQFVTTAGGTLNMGSSYRIINMSGAITNNGTVKTSVLTATSTTPFPVNRTWGGTGTVEYAATTGAQTVMMGTYNSLKLSNTSGTNTITGNVTINGTFTLSGGTVTTGSYLISITNTGSVTRTGGHVIGNFKKYVATGAISATFEVGDATNYTPATIAFASVTTADYVTVSVTATDHPNLSGSGIRTDRSVNRYFTITNQAIVFTTATVTFNWVAGDVDAGSTTANFKVGKYSSSAWSLSSIASPLATSIQATGITAFGDFAMGEQCTLASGFSYTGSPYCSNAGSATPTITGTAGTFASTAGLSINSATGVVNLSASTAGTYTVTNSASSSGGCSSSSTASIIITATPTTSNAGPDQTGSATCGLTTVTLAGNSPSVGTGAWSIVSGTGGTVTTPSNATSTFTGTAGTTYTLRWTISNSPCTASTDDVVITFNQNPTASGTATETCFGGSTGTITASATGGSAPYTYSLNAGAYQASATFTALAAVTYTLNAKSNAGCIASTSVTVSPSGSNLLLNPGFESPVVSNLNNNNLQPGTVWGNWTVNFSGGFNIIKVNGTAYTYGPDNASDGFQYIDIASAGGTLSQTFTLTNPSSITFVGYVSNRESASGSYVASQGFVEIVNASSVVVATSNVVNLTSALGDETWFNTSGSSSALLPAGTYTYKATIGNYAHFDNASVYINTSVSGTATESCVGGSTGTITATATGGSAPYTYSLNAGAYQASATFTGLAAGTYTLNAKSNAGCVASTFVTVNEYANSADDQNASATNSWIGHMYDGTTFTNYIGQFTEAETFNETFGGDYTCFNVISNSLTSSIYTETFSTKLRMNSTKRGLYVANLGSDDGSRLTIDGTMVYNNWTDQAFSSKPSVLMNLTGASSLFYEFYEAGGGNQLAFQNLTLVLANTLSSNTTQSICIGNTGAAISGDVYGTLPTGITLSGTGYQWSYSTTAGGARTNITGATAATFMPSSTVAPFNTAGTYYLYRNAVLSSANNVSPATYVATNESNAATITISALPSATISYTGTPYCSSAGTATVTRSGTAGGTYSSTAGLTINSGTGDITLASSTAGTYTVTYTMVNGACTVTATTSVTITTQPFANGTYPGSPFCINGGYAYPSGSAVGAAGTLSSSAGLSINSSTGVVNLGASTAGSYTITYSVAASGGCAAYSNTTPITITAAPSATISYAASPYCYTCGTASVTRTGTAGGTYTASPSGLSINSSTGAVTLNLSTPNTYTVTYTVAASGGCSVFTTTATIVVTAQDFDGDGIPDITDIDDDNDGIPDVIEVCGSGATSFSCLTADPSADSDGDGIVNYRDANFGTLNAAGCVATLDSDGDGIPNFLDRDSDNDGIPDVVEAFGVDANGDGIIDNFTDTDNDGLSQNVDANNTGAASSGNGLGFIDYDGDGVPNTTDLDSDNDGIPDIREALAPDTNNDGRADSFTDANGNGLHDSYESAGALIKTGADTNNDGKADSYPNKNADLTGYPNPYDLDSDGDGIVDVIEFYGVNYGSASITNGKQNGTRVNGWSTTVSGSTTSSLVIPNTDGRGPADFLDIDSDDDGIGDNIEAQPTSSYKVPADVDTDNDGIADVFEVSVGTYGASGLTPYDHDADGTPDYLDSDSDNDGAPDLTEASQQFTLTQSNINTTDTDGDGMVDQFDTNTITALTAGNYYLNVTNSKMGANGSLSGPTPSGSNTKLVQSVAGANRDFRNASILPLNIISFSGNILSEVATLNWKVENELQVNYYIIQRSTNGQQFDSVGIVKALNASSAAYNFRDDLKNVTSSTVYYKIRQVNKNGENILTQIILLKVGKTSITQVNIFPNPVREVMNVVLQSQIKDVVEVSVTDVQGKTVISKKFSIDKGTNSLSIPGIRTLSKGMYLLNVKMQGQILPNKFIIE